MSDTSGHSTPAQAPNAADNSMNTDPTVKEPRAKRRKLSPVKDDKPRPPVFIRPAPLVSARDLAFPYGVSLPQGGSRDESPITRTRPKTVLNSKRSSALNLKNYPSSQHPAGMAIWILQKIEQMRRDRLEVLPTPVSTAGQWNSQPGNFRFPPNAPGQRPDLEWTQPSLQSQGDQWSPQQNGDGSTSNDESDAQRLQSQRDRKTKQRSENWVKNKENDVVARAKLEAKKKFTADHTEAQRQQWIEERIKEDFDRLLNRLAAQFHGDLANLAPFQLGYAEYFFNQEFWPQGYDPQILLAGKLLADVLPGLIESTVSSRSEEAVTIFLTALDNSTPSHICFFEAIRILSENKEVIEGTERVHALLFAPKAGPHLSRQRGRGTEQARPPNNPVNSLPTTPHTGVGVWQWKEPATLENSPRPPAAPPRSLSTSAQTFGDSTYPAYPHQQSPTFAYQGVYAYSPTAWGQQQQPQYPQPPRNQSLARDSNLQVPANNASPNVGDEVATTATFEGVGLNAQFHGDLTNNGDDKAFPQLDNGSSQCGEEVDLQPTVTTESSGTNSSTIVVHQDLLSVARKNDHKNAKQVEITANGSAGASKNGLETGNHRPYSPIPESESNGNLEGSAEETPLPRETESPDPLSLVDGDDALAEFSVTSARSATPPSSGRTVSRISTKLRGRSTKSHGSDSTPKSQTKYSSDTIEVFTSQTSAETGNDSSHASVSRESGTTPSKRTTRSSARFSSITNPEIGMSKSEDDDQMTGPSNGEPEDTLGTRVDSDAPQLRSSGRERKPTAKALALSKVTATRKRSASPTMSPPPSKLPRLSAPARRMSSALRVSTTPPQELGSPAPMDEADSLAQDTPLLKPPSILEQDADTSRIPEPQCSIGVTASRENLLEQPLQISGPKAQPQDRPDGEVITVSQELDGTSQLADTINEAPRVIPLAASNNFGFNPPPPTQVASSEIEVVPGELSITGTAPAHGVGSFTQVNRVTGDMAAENVDFPAFIEKEESAAKAPEIDSSLLVWASIAAAWPDSEEADDLNGSPASEAKYQRAVVELLREYGKRKQILQPTTDGLQPEIVATHRSDFSGPGQRTLISSSDQTIYQGVERIFVPPANTILNAGDSYEASRVFKRLSTVDPGLRRHEMVETQTLRPGQGFRQLSVATPGPLNSSPRSKLSIQPAYNHGSMSPGSPFGAGKAPVQQIADKYHALMEARNAARDRGLPINDGMGWEEMQSMIRSHDARIQTNINRPTRPSIHHPISEIPANLFNKALRPSPAPTFSGPQPTPYMPIAPTPWLTASSHPQAPRHSIAPSPNYVPSLVAISPALRQASNGLPALAPAPPQRPPQFSPYPRYSGYPSYPAMPQPFLAYSGPPHEMRMGKMVTSNSSITNSPSNSSSASRPPPAAGSRYRIDPRGLNGEKPGGGTIINPKETQEVAKERRKQEAPSTGGSSGRASPAASQAQFKKGGQLMNFGHAT